MDISAEALYAVDINRLLDIFIAIVFGLLGMTGDIGWESFIRPVTWLAFTVIVAASWLLSVYQIPSILTGAISKLDKNPRGWAKKECSVSPPIDLKNRGDGPPFRIAESA